MVTTAHVYNHKSRELQTVLEGVPAYWTHEDKKGALWLTTAKGLYNLPSKQFYLDSLNGSSLSVQHIYESSNGDFWLSSNQGLIHWTPLGKIRQKISTEEGLSSNNVHAVYPDKRGVLWLSTDYGVCAFDPNTNRIQNFFESDGLVNNEFNYLAHCSTEDGQLIFGGTNGVSAFYPDSISLFEDSLNYDIFVGGAIMSRNTVNL